MEQPQKQYKQATHSKTTRSLPLAAPSGKISPHDTAGERAVLGALMIDNNALNEVIDVLSEEVFYDPKHQIIYSAIHTLFSNTKPLDFITIAAQLESTEELERIGGVSYLTELTQQVVSSAHIEEHARIITQKFLLRKLIEVSNEIVEEAYSPRTDAIELLDRAESKLFDVTNGNMKRSYETAESLVSKAVDRIEEVSKTKGLSGVTTGFKLIDGLFNGWQPSDLVILAARPGMGKTAFVLSMARNMAVDADIPVAFFSLEMSGIQLITRMISSETGIPSHLINSGKLKDGQWQTLMSRVQRLEKAPLYIDDFPGITIFDLRAKCRRLVAQKGVQIIIIDYLQLISSGGKGGNREQEISIISRSLKGIAKELNVPVIALSQLSRNVESRPNSSKRPMLSDLRESGAIEQDADIVTFLYRPEYYKQEVWDDDPNDPCIGEAEFIVAKHRNGGLENIRIKFIGELLRFEDLPLKAFDGGSSGGAMLESKMNSDFGDDPFGTSDSSSNSGFGSPEDAFS